MSNKITDLEKVKQEKRVGIGWGLEEIRKNAEKELKTYNTNAENEPNNLASGRMESAFEDQEPGEE